MPVLNDRQLEGQLVAGATGAAGTQRRERLRFTNFGFERTPNGQCSAMVELEWVGGVKVRGTASGQSSPLGDYRIAAEAALHALEEFTQGSMHFELIGVRALRAFDTNVVICALTVKRGETPERLLGSHMAESDPLRASVISVLSATNRILGNYIATR